MTINRNCFWWVLLKYLHRVQTTLSVFQLSPKKTWEGFIGGFLATVFFGLIVSIWRQSFFPNSSLTYTPIGCIYFLTRKSKDLSLLVVRGRVDEPKGNFTMKVALFIILMLKIQLHSIQDSHQHSKIRIIVLSWKCYQQNLSWAPLRLLNTRVIT